MFFKFMLSKISAYLSHKYYRSFFLFAAAESFYYSSHTQIAKRQSRVKQEEKKRPDMNMCHPRRKKRNKKRETFLMKIWKFNSAFYPFHICLLNFCHFSSLRRLSFPSFTTHKHPSNPPQQLKWLHSTKHA